MFNSNPGKYLAGWASRNAIAAYREHQEKTMTNAIEQAKREMYDYLASVKSTTMQGFSPKYTIKRLESALESYLELLRQDHEALHETARKRFEDIRNLWTANDDLAQRLARMTEERDAIQLRLHAVDHAYNEQQSRGATLVSNSGGNVSSATPDAKTMALLGALVDAQRIMTGYLVPDGIRAKEAIGKLIPVLDNENLSMAMREFEHAAAIDQVKMAHTCMHQFHKLPTGRNDDTEVCVFCGVEK